MSDYGPHGAHGYVTHCTGSVQWYGGQHTGIANVVFGSPTSYLSEYTELSQQHGMGEVPEHGSREPHGVQKGMQIG